MTRRQGRWWRPDRWNTRPAQRALSSVPRRQRYTKASLDAAAEVSMKVGESMGRRWAERDLFRALAEDFLLREDAIPDDVLNLAAYIGGRAMADGLDDFLLTERARQADPEGFHRLADAIEDGNVPDVLEALESMREKMGLRPEDIEKARAEEERSWWEDDLTDVAREAGVLDGDEDRALWDSVPPKQGGEPECNVVEIEQWLRERDRWIENLRRHGELPDDKDGGE